MNKKNINRLLQQKNGDKSLLLLGIYSLIEGYIRGKISYLNYNKNIIFDSDSEEEKQKKKTNQRFHTVLWKFFCNKTKVYEEIEKYKEDNGFGRYDYIPDMSPIYDKVIKKHPELYTFLFNEIETYHKKYANSVRHNFNNLDSGIINTAISHFISFARMENFHTPKLETLSDFSDWKTRTPPVDNEQYNNILQELKMITDKNQANEISLANAILEKEQLEEKNNKLELEKVELLKQKDKINEKNDELRKKAFELKEKIKELNAQENKDDIIKKELTSLQSKLDRISKEKDHQETLLLEKQKQIESLSKSNESLAEQNKELVNDQKKLEERYNNLDKEAQSIKKQIVVLNEHGDENQEKMQKLQADYEKIILLKNEQENQLIEKQAEIDKLNQSYVDLSTMAQDLEKQKIETENALQQTLEETSELRTQIRELEQKPILTPEKEEELKKLQERYSNLKKALANHRRYRDEIQKEHLERVEALQKDAELYLENANILQAYASAARNYHARILKLSPEQEKLVDEICSHLEDLDNSNSTRDFLIKGGPGTGKTLVLIKILERFATTIKDKNVKLLTYTDSLSKYNQYLSQEYEKKNPKTGKNVSRFMQENIETFDSYFIPKIEEILKKKIYNLDFKDENVENSQEYKNLYKIFYSLNKENAKDITEGNLEKNTKIIMKEALNEIWTFSPSKQEYVTKSYSGTGINLTDKELSSRTYIWDITEKAVLEIEKQDMIPAIFAYHKIGVEDKYSLLSDTYKLDYLLIDEIQDLSPSRIKIISKLNKRSCVMVGDLNQSVFIKRGLSWVELSIKLEGQGKVYILDKNYRSTINIQKLANRYRKICKIKDDEAISESFIPGQDPEMSTSKDIEEALDKILHKVQCYINVMRFNHEDICIVVPTDLELIRIKGLLSDHQIKSMDLSEQDFDFTKKGVIRLSTTKHVKGIDSPIIILLLTENFTDPSKNGNTDAMSQMNCIYSCITRTMDLLYIQITENTFLSNLDGNNENSVTKLKRIWK